MDTAEILFPLLVDSVGKLRITFRRTEFQLFENLREFYTVSKNPDLSEYFDHASNCKSHFSSLCPGGSTEKKRTILQGRHIYLCYNG